MEQAMRVLIADDHGLLRDTLELLLDNAGGFETLSVSDFPAALAAISGRGPFDLVILDLDMPGMNGLDGLDRALVHDGGQRVALMSGVVGRDVARQALARGAAGFVPKTLPAKPLVNAVRFMAMGEQFAPIDFMTEPEDAAPESPLVRKLTKREREVLAGLTHGKSNKQIAYDLDILEPTVKLHVKTLFRKLEVVNRTQAALIARENGFN
jgi:two-component system nitrate/nitrite response regulator NarL